MNENIQCNRGSFKFGGRSYGALHQSLRKELRPHIHINGNGTVEVDYSAYHIRMLYHKEGIDFREDPYVVCEGRFHLTFLMGIIRYP